MTILKKKLLYPTSLKINFVVVLVASRGTLTLMDFLNSYPHYHPNPKNMPCALCSPILFLDIHLPCVYKICQTILIHVIHYIPNTKYKSFQVISLVEYEG